MRSDYLISVVLLSVISCGSASADVLKAPSLSSISYIVDTEAQATARIEPALTLRSDPRFAVKDILEQDPMELVNDPFVEPVDFNYPAGKLITLHQSFTRRGLFATYAYRLHQPLETLAAAGNANVLVHPDQEHEWASRPYRHTHQSATVNRSFKGSCDNSLRYRVDWPRSTNDRQAFGSIVSYAANPPPQPLPNRLKLDEGEACLVFLSRGDADLRNGLTPLEWKPEEYFISGETVSEYIQRGNGNSDPILTMDFRILTDREEICDAVEIATSAMQPTRFATIEAPTSHFDEMRSHGIDPLQPLGFTVPCDQRLEVQLHRWIATGEVFERAAAVRHLDLFGHTEQSERIARAALADAGSFVVERDHVRYRVYPVRASAVGLLRTWHVTFDLPMLEERID